MTTTTSTRHETATRFLAALAATAGRGELLELRYRLDDGQRMGQVFDRADRLRGLATRAIALGRRTDVYVGCAPRTRRHGGRDAVERAFALWADCDGEDCLAALGAFEPEPAIVIGSGTDSNCHAYWLLTAPLPRDELERANRRFAHALGADPASADAARILRVPGTFSHKHEPPTPVDAIRLDRDRRVDAIDVVGGLPEAADGDPRGVHASAPTGARGRSAAGDRPRRLRAPPAGRRGATPSQSAVPVPRRSACKPACLRERRAGLVLLRRLPARRHDLRPRRASVRLRRSRRGLPPAAC
jgi:RepB DNA-primase from phage plasmid